MNINYKTQAMVWYLFNKVLRKSNTVVTPFDWDSPIISIPLPSKVKGVDLRKSNGLFIFKFTSLKFSYGRNNFL